MNEIIDYKRLFKDAWMITWKNKVLWIFGIFIILGSGNSSLFDYSSSSDDYDEQDITRFVDFISNNLWVVWVALIAFLVVIVVFVVLRIISQASVIGFAGRKKEENLGFKYLFSKGKTFLARLFLVDLFVFLMTIGSLILLAAPPIFFFMSKNIFPGALLTVVAFMIYVPLIIVFSFSRRYAYMYIILGDMQTRPSLEIGYRMFRNNVWRSIIFSLLLFALQVIAGIALFVAVGVLAVIIVAPMFFIFESYFSSFGLPLRVVFISVAAVVAIVVAGLFLIYNSILAVFKEVSWTLFFKSISGQKNKEEQEERERVVIEKVPNPQGLQ